MAVPVHIKVISNTSTNIQVANKLTALKPNPPSIHIPGMMRELNAILAPLAGPKSSGTGIQPRQLPRQLPALPLGSLLGGDESQKSTERLEDPQRMGVADSMDENPPSSDPDSSAMGSDKESQASGKKASLTKHKSIAKSSDQPSTDNVEEPSNESAGASPLGSLGGL